MIIRLTRINISEEEQDEKNNCFILSLLHH